MRLQAGQFHSRRVFRWSRFFLQLATLPAVVAGCASFGNSTEFSPESFQSDPEWLHAAKFPLAFQEGRSDCGAAALSAVLSYWNIPVSIDEIRRECSAGPEGIRAAELRTFARQNGLKAFLVEGKSSDLEAELSRQRPVLVGLALENKTSAITHYEVVVGLHRKDRRIVTLDPAQGWREWAWDEFDRLWSPARRLSIVCFRAAE